MTEECCGDQGADQVFDEIIDLSIIASTQDLREFFVLWGWLFVAVFILRLLQRFKRWRTRRRLRRLARRENKRRARQAVNRG